MADVMVKYWPFQVQVPAEPRAVVMIVATAFMAGAAQAKLLRRFFDLLEANADTFWTAPQLSLDLPPVEPGRSDAGQREPLQGDDDEADCDGDDARPYDQHPTPQPVGCRQSA